MPEHGVKTVPWTEAVLAEKTAGAKITIELFLEVEELSAVDECMQKIAESSNALPCELKLQRIDAFTYDTPSMFRLAMVKCGARP